MSEQTITLQPSALLFKMGEKRVTVSDPVALASNIESAMARLGEATAKIADLVRICREEMTGVQVVAPADGTVATSVGPGALNDTEVIALQQGLFRWIDALGKN